jgi:hypothetical protein
VWGGGVDFIGFLTTLFQLEFTVAENKTSLGFSFLLSLAMLLIALVTLRRKELWLWVMKWECVEGSGGKYFIINPSIFLKEMSDT